MLKEEIKKLQSKKRWQTYMIVSEGTVFLLLLLFGVYKVKQAQDKEEELRRQQNNFFLSITHELKTPIAATKLQLQTIQKQKPEAAILDQLLANALEETERLNSLIDNVLLASRMDSPGFSVQPRPLNVSELGNKVLKRYYVAAIDSGRLYVDISEGLSALTEEQSFTSVLTNLVDNAIKYSPQHTRVEVQLKASNAFVSLSVKDLGNGIPKTEKEKIFTRFYRGGNEEQRRTKGTGLGLYIVKKLVEAQNGNLQHRDNTPNGSIFEIQLRAA